MFELNVKEKQTNINCIKQTNEKKLYVYDLSHTIYIQMMTCKQLSNNHDSDKNAPREKTRIWVGLYPIHVTRKGKNSSFDKQYFL